MFSADFFTIVESFLGAATSFVYSFFYSLYLLLRFPRAAPHFLGKRYADEKTRQVGPLTMIFLAVSVGVLAIYYGAGSSSLSTTSVNSMIDDIHDFIGARHRDTTLALIVAALAGTAIVDAFVRIFALTILLRTRTHITQSRLAKKRILFGYKFFVPCLIFSVFLLIEFYMLSQKNDIIIGATILVSFYIFPFLIPRLSLSIVLRDVLSKKRGFLLFFARQLISISICAGTITGAVYAYGVAPKLIPDSREFSTSAVEDDITFIYASCTLTKDRFIILGQLLNRSKSDLAVIGYNAGLTTDLDINSVERISVENHANQYFVIEPGKIYNYGGTADRTEASGKATKCNITWYLKDLLGNTSDTNLIYKAVYLQSKN